MPAQSKSHRENAQDLRTVALLKTGRYSLPVAANSAVGLGGPNSTRRNSAPITIAGAFFVPAFLCYGGLRRSTLGCAGLLVRRSANPAQSVTQICLAADGDGSSVQGASHATRPQSVQKSRRCPSCNGSRRFTRQFQPRNTSRTLQRPYGQSPCS